MKYLSKVNSISDAVVNEYTTVYYCSNDKKVVMKNGDKLPPNNEIWYWSSKPLTYVDEEKSDDWLDSHVGFIYVYDFIRSGNEVISHSYDGEKWVLRLRDEITYIPQQFMTHNYLIVNKVRIPSSVISLGGECFYSCGFKSVGIEGSGADLILPSGLQSIGTMSLCGLLYCEYMEIPEGVSELGMQAIGYGFDSPKQMSMKYIILPKNISVISNRCCRRYSNMDYIKIWKGVKKIENYAFQWYWENDTKLLYDGTIEEWLSIEKEKSWKDSGHPLTTICSDGEYVNE